MSEAAVHWRIRLYRSAFVFMAIDITTYICGVVIVNVLGSMDAKIRAGAWFFLIGSAMSLFALMMSMFGHGRRRVVLALMCLLALPFWYGFTLY